MVTLGTLLFSAKSIVIQWLFGFGVSVEQLLLMRMMVSFPFYLILGGLPIRHMRRRGKRLPSLSQCLGMIVAGMLCYHAAAYLDMWALQRITAGLERTILFSYPLMVAIIQHFRGDKLKALQWASLGLAYVGIWLFFMKTTKFLAT
jgi:drug/metabolite transporter (DMT)-like permease